MKNIIITLVMTSLLIACGDSKNNRAVTNNNISNYGANNSHNVCSELLPWSIASQSGYDTDRYGVDYNRFYTKDGTYYVFRGNNKFIHMERGTITCERLHAIDEYHGFHPSCFNYEVTRNGYHHDEFIATHKRNNSEHRATYRSNNTYSFYIAKKRLVCPITTTYYDSYFILNHNHGQIYHQSGFQYQGHFYPSGNYDSSFLKKALGFAAFGALIHHFTK